MRVHILAATFVALTLVSGLVPARAQSLADVARKEQERRKTTKPATKVLTNKDLGSGALASPFVPPADPKALDAKSGEPEAPAAGAEAAPVRDQAYWSGRLKELRTQIDRDQTYSDALQSRINSLNADFVNRDDPAQRATIERDRQRAVAELERLSKAIAEGKKAVADLEEEARRAGVPPGWLR